MLRYFLISVTHIDIKRYLMLIIKVRRDSQDVAEKINFSRISLMDMVAEVIPPNAISRLSIRNKSGESI